jgi:hypothetical protein
MFDPEFDSQLCAAWLGTEGAAVDPHIALHVRERVDRYVKSVPNGQGCVVCTSAFRRQLGDLLERFGLRVDGFGFGELPGYISVRPALIVTDPRGALAPAVG